MNSFKPRMSYDLNYNPSFSLAQQHVQPSTQAKQLIEYLKSNPNPDINRKLRQQIFFKKINKPILINSQMKKSSSQDKLQYCQNKDKNLQSDDKQNCFINKTQNRKKAGFFSPKAQRQTNQKSETSPFMLFHKQSLPENQKSTKSSFRLRRDVMSLNQNLVCSQKDIFFDKRPKQCPFFLKKAPKTTNCIKSSIDQNSLKIQDFVILKNLGQGTFGEVFAAIHKPTQSIYTIKKYKKQIIKAHQLQDKFLNDIKVQLKFIHPHIVKLYGFFDDAQYFYMIFEYMESGNLSKTIEQKGGNLAQLDVCRKIYQINDALLFLHDKKLIHKDIKPASILTCLNVCKLCDTQWLQENDDTSHHNTLCKQIDYTAPEALEGKQITPEFDVWGLGLIAFQLLTGKKFIVGSTQKILIRKIITLKKQLVQVMLPKNCSQSLRHLILSALQPVPSKRIKSSQINQMKIYKERQLSANLLSSKNLPFSQKNISPPSQKTTSTLQQPRGSPKNGIIFGVKKQIKNEVSTLL